MIGGQALIEGIMMLGPDKSAVVVRTKEGLKEKIEDRPKPSFGFSVKKLPFIRGLFNFWTSMKIGVGAMMYMVMILTLNLGIMNLLPLPALDGGRIFFLIVEFIRRKPVKPELEGYVHAAGMIILMLFMVIVTYNDIVRLITG